MVERHFGFWSCLIAGGGVVLTWRLGESLVTCLGKGCGVAVAVDM